MGSDNEQLQADAISLAKRIAEPGEFVSCDENCGAKVNPVSRKELEAAIRHWREHSVQGGCSHGI